MIIKTCSWCGKDFHTEDESRDWLSLCDDCEHRGYNPAVWTDDDEWVMPNGFLDEDV